MCQRVPGHKEKAEMDTNGSLWEQGSEGGKIVAVNGWFFMRWIFIMVSLFNLYSYITLHKNTKIVIKMFRKRHLISDMSVSSFQSVNLLPILIPVASPEPQVHLLSDKISLYLITSMGVGKRSWEINPCRWWFGDSGPQPSWDGGGLEVHYLENCLNSPCPLHPQSHNSWFSGDFLGTSPLDLLS